MLAHGSAARYGAHRQTVSESPPQPGVQQIPQRAALNDLS